MPLMLKDITIDGIETGLRRALTSLVNAVDQNGLTPAIDTRYPMAELHAALDHLDRLPSSAGSRLRRRRGLRQHLLSIRIQCRRSSCVGELFDEQSESVGVVARA